MKKPRLFYWEDGFDAWCPAPKNTDNMIDAESHFSQCGEEIELRFKRIDMTDEEFANIPEGA